MKNFIYQNQIVHHKPCFNLSIFHNNLLDNHGSEINNVSTRLYYIIILRFDILSFTKIFPPSFALFSLYICIYNTLVNLVILVTF